MIYKIIRADYSKKKILIFLGISIFIVNLALISTPNHERKFGATSRTPDVSVGSLIEVEWNTTWGEFYGGGSYSEKPWGVALDSFGNIFITGISSKSYLGNENIFLVKFNSSGHYQWHRIFDGGLNERAYGIALDSNYNIYLGGMARDLNGLESYILLVKYDGLGNYQWNITQEENHSGAFGIAVDSFDDIYLTGYLEKASDDGEIYLTKYNSLGEHQWNRTIADGYGTDIAIDSENNVIVVGTHYEAFDKTSACILNFTEQGEFQGNYSFSSNEINWGIAVVMDPEDNIFISGISFNST